MEVTYCYAWDEGWYYLNLVQNNDHLRWCEELVERQSQPLRQWRQLIEHNSSELPMSIVLDKPTDMPDIAHQPHQTITLNPWQRPGQPRARPDQHVMRQHVQQHHHLLCLEALLIALGDAQSL